MIYLYFGANRYASDAKIKTWRKKFQTAEGDSAAFFNWRVFDEEQKDFNKILDTLFAKSFFSQKRAVILKNILARLSEKDLIKLETVLATKKLTPDLTLIFSEKEIDARKKIIKTLKKIARVEEFKAMPPWQIKAWIAKKVKAEDGTIENAALEKISFLTTDLYRLENELKKLMLFTNRDKRITLDAVNLLVVFDLKESIFNFVENVAAKKKSAALNFFQNEIKRGTGPPYLVTMIAYQFKNLLQIKYLVEKGFQEKQIIETAKIHPYALRKNLPLLQNFTLNALKRIYREILVLDLEVKTQKNPLEAFENFLLKI